MIIIKPCVPIMVVGAAEYIMTDATTAAEPYNLSVTVFSRQLYTPKSERATARIAYYTSP